jgi:aspartate/methionine/tyrosine aminotransferase
MQLSKAANRLQGQPMFKMLDKIKELSKTGQSFIHFEIGDPNFDTPDPIKKAAIEAIQSGDTHYVSSAGIFDLKHEISKFYSEYFGAEFDHENVVIAPGCNPLIFSLIQCCVDHGENVIITDPCFSTYPSALGFLGIDYKTVPLREENKFCVDIKEIKEAVDSKTKMIIINSPNNPTGSVMDPSEIEAIIKFASEKGIFVLSDEIYSLLCFTPIMFSASEWIKKYNNVAVISGFSKPFAMSGWRIGYMIAPRYLCEKISLYLQTTVSCTTSFAQSACVTALSCMHDVHQMKHEYMRRRNYIVDRLNKTKGIRCQLPMGAFYAFANVSGTGMSGEEFCEQMLLNSVALLPGTSFGPFSKEYVRFCYTRPMEEIEEGLNRVERGLL